MADIGETIYKKMYSTLFNAVTDALEDMYQQDFAHAGLRLQLAQREVEEMFLIWEDEQENRQEET